MAVRGHLLPGSDGDHPTTIYGYDAPLRRKAHIRRIWGARCLASQDQHLSAAS